MCGLGFLHDPTLAPDLLRAAGEGLARHLRHRGPDDAGVWCEAPAVFGHTRLAIVGLDDSIQPMTDPEGRWVLAYNGEAYNYRELRRSLVDRWRFRTGGDTEVLLAGLVLDGPFFLERVEGMWALALWDRHERRLLAARDRLGKKPLYYCVDGERFACASELPALRAAIPDRFDEDLDSAADYLRYGFALPGYTAYLNVRELVAGHLLRWRPGRQPEVERYWSPPTKPFDGNRHEAETLLRETLIRAVERRLVAEVEVGALLSGGIDSSLLVAILSRELGRRPKTFTLGFADASFDERQPAREIARWCETDHHEEVLTTWNSDHLERLLLEHLGQPFADPSLLATAAVAELAARTVKVVISGDGGDELFSGYQRYQAASLLGIYNAIPQPLRRPLEAGLRALPEPRVHHSRSVLKKAHLFVDIVEREREDVAYLAPRVLSERTLERLAPDLRGRGHRSTVAMPAADERASPAQARAFRDLLVYLPQDILTKVDRATMASSLEARCPLLDREVVELAVRLLPSWHRRSGVGKRMLRSTFGDLLPPSAWNRNKQGFGVPVGRWMAGRLGDRLSELLAAVPSPLDRAASEALLTEHRSGRRDRGHALWALYVNLLFRRASALPSPGGP